MRSSKHRPTYVAHTVTIVKRSGNITFVNSVESLDFPVTGAIAAASFWESSSSGRWKLPIVRRLTGRALTDPRPRAERRASMTGRKCRPLILKQRSIVNATSSSFCTSSSPPSAHRSLNRREWISHQRPYRKQRVCRMCLSIDRREFCFVRLIIYSVFVQLSAGSGGSIACR